MTEPTTERTLTDGDGRRAEEKINFLHPPNTTHPPSRPHALASGHLNHSLSHIPSPKKKKFFTHKKKLYQQNKVTRAIAPPRAAMAGPEGVGRGYLGEGREQITVGSWRVVSHVPDAPLFPLYFSCPYVSFYLNSRSVFLSIGVCGIMCRYLHISVFVTACVQCIFGKLLACLQQLYP